MQRQENTEARYFKKIISNLPGCTVMQIQNQGQIEVHIQSSILEYIPFKICNNNLIHYGFSS